MTIWRIFGIALSCTIILSGCATRHPVHRVTKDSPRGQGVYYALPYTKFLVAVPVVKSVTTPGKYRDLVDDYFYISAEKMTQLASAKKETSFKLGKPVITRVTVADENEVFRIQVTAGAFQRRALELKLSNLGLLTDATSVSEDKKLEVALKSIEIVASTAAAVFTGQAGVINLEAVSLVTPQVPFPALMSVKEREAAAIVSRIERIQDQRIELLTGNTSVEHVEKLTLDEMLKQLADIEKGLLGQFFGTTKKTPWTAQFLVDPAVVDKDNPIKGVDLFRFNPALGIRASANLLEPPPGKFTYDEIDFATLENSINDMSEEEKAAVIILAKEEFVGIASKEIQGFAHKVDPDYHAGEERPETSGFFYRIPAQGTVRVVRGSVSDSDKPDWDSVGDLIRTNTIVAQYGVVVSLPISPGSLLKSNYGLTLYEETGALKTFVSGSDPIDAAFLETSLKPAAAAVGQAVVAHETLQAKREAAREAKRQELLQSVIQATEEQGSNAIEQAISLLNQFGGVGSTGG